MPNRRRIYSVLIQVVIWSVFLILPYVNLPRTATSPHRELLVNRDMQPHWEEYSFLYAFAINFCLLIFFYIHDRYIFRLIRTSRYIEYVAVIILSFFTVFTVTYLFREVLQNYWQLYDTPLELRNFIRVALWFFVILFAAFGIGITDLWREAEQRTRSIETEQLRTELAFLHMQINPHFLFNSLNTIYGLSLKKSDNAPKAVLKLSQLMRYMIEENGHDLVPLDQEINYLNNYIEIQKMRSSAAVQVTFDVTGDTSTAMIAPMLMMPFVENAFKYGISNSAPSPIALTLTVNRDSIIFIVANKKFDYLERHSSGIGIANVQRRLDLLYPGKHELDIRDHTDTYSLSLKILLS
ncbi:MAG: histidine kinase [Bacteroidetes bacterium]|nr:histidine kinase [Bacteroidota bacterium]